MGVKLGFVKRLQKYSYYWRVNVIKGNKTGLKCFSSFVNPWSILFSLGKNCEEDNIILIIKNNNNLGYAKIKRIYPTSRLNGLISEHV